MTDWVTIVKKNIIKLLPVFSLIIIAAFLRFWGIVHGSFAFTFDTGRDLLAVRDLVYNHKLSLIGPTSGQMGIFYGPWWYWILAAPFVITAGNPALLNIFMGVSGVLAAVLAYWWGKDWQDEIFGLILAGIIGAGWYFVSSTIQLWSPDLLVLGTLVVLILLAKIKELKRWQLFLAGFFLALLSEMEIVFGVIFIIATLLSLVIWEKRIIFSRKIIFLSGGLLTAELPRIIFELRHNFLQTKALLTVFKPNNSVYHFDIRLQLIWEKLQAVLPFNNFYLNLFFGVLAAGLFIFAFFSSKEERKQFLAKLLFIGLFFLLFIIFYPNTIWDYYLLGLPVILAILISYAIARYIKKTGGKKWVLGIIIFLVFLSRPAEIIRNIQNPNFSGNASVYRNQLAVLDYIYRQANKNNFNYIAYTPPQIEYTWRYLFWWYGRNKYGYEPVIKRQQRFYVIIEPDPGYPDRIKDWLKIRENDGKITKEYTLPSGIMVQTRVRPKE
ncbi:MAG: hypothetical protein M1120_02890 [Patescibacteria group bacterium]|nr:hypothetical protein [Patescibacteria group bacterium]